MPTARGFYASALLSGLLFSISPALAMPESCQKDFTPMMNKRQQYMNQINGFKNKKPTAPQACTIFSGFSAQNSKIVAWMTAQKDWCQIPDEMLSGMKDQQGQIDKVRSNACGVAAKQAQMIQQMKRRAAQQGARQAGPGIGSGVRLPQGAL